MVEKDWENAKWIGDENHRLIRVYLYFNEDEKINKYNNNADDLRIYNDMYRITKCTNKREREQSTAVLIYKPIFPINWPYAEPNP